MAIPSPGKIVGAIAYLDGNEVLGSVEMTLPDIKFLTEAVDSLASSGEVDLILPKLEKMVTEIKANVPSDVLAKAAFSRGSNLILDARGSWQVDDPATGTFAVGEKIIFHVRGLGMGLGSQGNSSGGERTGTFAVYGLEYSIDNVEQLYWMGLGQNILRIDGVDQMQVHRNNLGT